MPITRARLKISDYNENRKRQISKNERRIRGASLSLTSMVDMFAILVIYLLTNDTSVSQWLNIDHPIELPKAQFADQPKKSAALQVAKDAIYAEKKRLISIGQAKHSGQILGPVRDWLSKQEKKDGYVSILADKEVSFGVIKKLIATCEASGFANVNLAVQPKSPQKGS